MTSEVVVSLDSLAEEIRSEHQSCLQSLRKGMEHALKVGELLLQAKQLVKHGDWGYWVEKNCDFTPRMARNYMKLAGAKDVLKTETISEMTLQDALNRVDVETRWKKRVAKEKRLKFENEDRQVKDFLDAVKLFRKSFTGEVDTFKVAISDAVDAAEFGKFSPEAKKYTIRRINDARKTIEKVDEVGRKLDELEAVLEERKTSWFKDVEVLRVLSVFRKLSNTIYRLKKDGQDGTAKKILEQWEGYFVTWLKDIRN